MNRYGARFCCFRRLLIYPVPISLACSLSLLLGFAPVSFHSVGSVSCFCFFVRSLVFAASSRFASGSACLCCLFAFFFSAACLRLLASSFRFCCLRLLLLLAVCACVCFCFLLTIACVCACFGCLSALSWDLSLASFRSARATDYGKKVSAGVRCDTRTGDGEFENASQRWARDRRYKKRGGRDRHRQHRPSALQSQDDGKHIPTAVCSMRCQVYYSIPGIYFLQNTWTKNPQNSSLLPGIY